MTKTELQQHMITLSNEVNTFQTECNFYRGGPSIEDRIYLLERLVTNALHIISELIDNMPDDTQ